MGPGCFFEVFYTVPLTDESCSQWRAVQLQGASGRRGGLAQALRQLADGHWVLAFQDSERSAAACSLLQQHAAKLRAGYVEALAPLLQPLT